MRLAGIMKTYSKKAMPQLARMTSQSGELLNFGFRLPYHANVMKMFEQVSSTTGSQRDSRSWFMLKTVLLWQTVYHFFQNIHGQFPGVGNSPCPAKIGWHAGYF